MQVMKHLQPGHAISNTDVEVVFLNSKISFCLWKQSLSGWAAVPGSGHLAYPILGKEVNIVEGCTPWNLDIWCILTL